MASVGALMRTAKKYLERGATMESGALEGVSTEITKSHLKSFVLFSKFNQESKKQIPRF